MWIFTRSCLTHLFLFCSDPFLPAHFHFFPTLALLFFRMKPTTTTTKTTTTFRKFPKIDYAQTNPTTPPPRPPIPPPNNALPPPQMCPDLPPPRGGSGTYPRRDQELRQDRPREGPADVEVRRRSRPRFPRRRRGRHGHRGRVRDRDPRRRGRQDRKRPGRRGVRFRPSHGQVGGGEREGGRWCVCVRTCVREGKSRCIAPGGGKGERDMNGDWIRWESVGILSDF